VRDPIQEQFDARLLWLDESTWSAWVPEYLKLARENAALRRLCARAVEHIGDVDLASKKECCFLDSLVAAASGLEVM